MQPQAEKRRFPLDYASPKLRPAGSRCIATAEIASIVAALGAAGALITLCHDFLTDPRGWQTNDALVFCLYAGSAAALVSVTCFGIARYLKPFALRKRAVIGILADGVALALLSIIWLARIAR